MNEKSLKKDHELRVGNYCARLVFPYESAEFDACLRLRYEYFVQRRGWVNPQPEHPGVDRDHYDEYALHLAVFEGDDIIAYLRLLPYQEKVGFMLDHEFGCLLSEDDLCLLKATSNVAVELSRLVCRDNPSKNKGFSSPHPLELMLKLLYAIALSNDFKCFYIVVEKAWLKPFARSFGLPFRAIGAPFIFPDGTQTVAATATMEELETAMERHNRDKHKWYRQTSENP